MSSSRPTTVVVAAVVGVLSPHLGDLMSRRAVEGQRERLGLSADRLTPDEVELLLQHVSLALELFIGTERAVGVVTAARTSIAGVPVE